ncbi:hypothetical protein [Sorangium sp. So ce1099]|uniref:hypothetical protein n=1 Tax=Sorangium sp. So ce1099 TaxID=3133331 RepID=UPI003F628693
MSGSAPPPARAFFSRHWFGSPWCWAFTAMIVLIGPSAFDRQRRIISRWCGSYWSR